MSCNYLEACFIFFGGGSWMDRVGPHLAVLRTHSLCSSLTLSSTQDPYVFLGIEPASIKNKASDLTLVLALWPLDSCFPYLKIENRLGIWLRGKMLTLHMQGRVFIPSIVTK